MLTKSDDLCSSPPCCGGLTHSPAIFTHYSHTWACCAGTSSALNRPSLQCTSRMTSPAMACLTLRQRCCSSCSSADLQDGIYQQKNSQQILSFPSACKETLRSYLYLRSGAAFKAYLSVLSAPAPAPAAAASSAWLRLNAVVPLCVSRRTCTGFCHQQCLPRGPPSHAPLRQGDLLRLMQGADSSERAAPSSASHRG